MKIETAPKMKAVKNCLTLMLFDFCKAMTLAFCAGVSC
jgi:hypothetical protein